MELAPEVEAWLRAAGHAPETLVALPGDVSVRRYARLGAAAGGTAILAVYPPSILASCHRFLATTQLLEGIGVAVPRIVASDCECGVMLVEDVGPRTLYDLATEPWAALTPLFHRAAEIAERIAGLPAAAVAALNPPLDGELLARELRQTWEVFLEPHGLLGGAAEARRLEDALGALCEALGAAGAVPCHRDFMARNLAVRVFGSPSGLGLWVLDHQDLRLGPPFYDLASLLNDSLFPPPELTAEILASRLSTAAQRLAYHRAAAQRTLKAVGTFAAFARRGIDRHLPLIPPTLARALFHLARTPEGEGLVPALSRRVAASGFC